MQYSYNLNHLPGTAGDFDFEDDTKSIAVSALKIFSFSAQHVKFCLVINRKEKLKMIRKEIKSMVIGLFAVIAFVFWTLMIKTIDVKPAGINGTDIGFANLNVFVHSLIGVNMTLYNITDWMGIIPVLICILLGFIGFVQLIKRKSLFKVDYDIIVSGVYYIIIILLYLFFEMYPINYRPILINGYMEASYPSSTTLLVLSVMPTLAFLIDRRLKNGIIKNIILNITIIFSVFTVIGRIISGVHWITDIIGSVLISTGLFFIYKSTVFIIDKNKSEDRYGIQ